MSFEETLAAWLPSQRWFAGKGAPIHDLVIAADTTLAPGDPGLRHLIVTVFQPGQADSYQLFVGLRSQVPDWLRHAVIGPDEGATAYDALHDPGLTGLLLDLIASPREVGPLRFRREPGAEIETGLDSLALTAEQSNTSLVFGESAILKVFRRPAPGPNPDLEVPRALARLGSPHVAAPLGWIETATDGADTVLAILSTYLRSASDGWSLAATSVRDLLADGAADAASAGGDFAGEAERLGAATAAVHRALATAFGSRLLPPGAARELAGQMSRKLDRALATAPALAPHAGTARAAFADLAAQDAPLRVQRVHGDYHLGQVLRTHAGWVVLDFEGEPAAPLDERRAASSPLRDVAGMLRSLDYAARCQLPAHDGDQRVHDAARDWVRRNQDAFCSGYAGAGGADPGAHAVLLRALVLDKAVYEVMYEARHRPSWLPIPLSAFADA